MLLKTVETPIAYKSLSGERVLINTLHSDREIEIKPCIKIESFVDIGGKFKVFHINARNFQIGDLAGDPHLPNNAVGQILYDFCEELKSFRKNVYITDDQEAYIIGDTGVTVSVINTPKSAAEGMTLRGTGVTHLNNVDQVTLVSESDVTITANQIKFHRR